LEVVVDAGAYRDYPVGERVKEHPRKPPGPCPGKNPRVAVLGYDYPGRAAEIRQQHQNIGFGKKGNDNIRPKSIEDLPKNLDSPEISTDFNPQAAGFPTHSEPDPMGCQRKPVKTGGFRFQGDNAQPEAVPSPMVGQTYEHSLGPAWAQAGNHKRNMRR